MNERVSHKILEVVDLLKGQEHLTLKAFDHFMSSTVIWELDGLLRVIALSYYKAEKDLYGEGEVEND